MDILDVLNAVDSDYNKAMLLSKTISTVTSENVIDVLKCFSSDYYISTVFGQIVTSGSYGQIMTSEKDNHSHDKLLQCIAMISSDYYRSCCIQVAFAKCETIALAEKLIKLVSSDYYKIEVLKFCNERSPILRNKINEASVADQKKFIHLISSESYQRQAMDILGMELEVREIVSPPQGSSSFGTITITVEGNCSHPLVKSINDLVIRSNCSGMSVSMSANRSVFELRA